MTCPVALAKWSVRLAGGEDVSMQLSVETYPRAGVERTIKVEQMICGRLARKSYEGRQPRFWA